MKTLIIVLLYLIASCEAWKNFHLGREKGGNLKAPHTTGYNLPPDQWFTQKIDHFNPTDGRTWRQRFFTNSSFYSRGGPIFLMIGGEGEASAHWMVEGAWIDYAKQYGALCFQLEHRYYGKSHPFPDLSVKNLQYLNSNQALADLAMFIEFINAEYQVSPSTKWIAFGGSYPGSLAAWLRMKYPHLVHGAMSASGPLLAQADFQEYYHVVYSSLRTHSESCLSQVTMAFSQIEMMMKHKNDQKLITETFKLCDPIELYSHSQKDISNFYETLASNFAGVVQYNKDNRQGKMAKISNITIDTVCGIMVDYSLGNPVSRLAKVNSVLMEAYDQKCLDYKYENMINSLRNMSADSDGARQWTYQTCTEFGFYQTSSYHPERFGNNFPLEFFTGMCTDVFGPKFNMSLLTDAVERTNTGYGGLDIQATNIVFVHGSIDPWHALGITKTLEQGAPAIYIQGTAHCANMYPPSDNDLPQLKASRVQIAQLIGSWLNL